MRTTAFVLMILGAFALGACEKKETIVVPSGGGTSKQTTTKETTKETVVNPGSGSGTSSSTTSSTTSTTTSK
jgi:hypothetical protein